MVSRRGRTRGAGWSAQSTACGASNGAGRRRGGALGDGALIAAPSQPEGGGLGRRAGGRRVPARVEGGRGEREPGEEGGLGRSGWAGVRAWWWRRR
jgi:hypothetical protein